MNLNFLSSFSTKVKIIASLVAGVVILSVGLGIYFKGRADANQATEVRELHETVDANSTHIGIEETQDEIRNRTISDDELFDSLLDDSY